MSTPHPSVPPVPGRRLLLAEDDDALRDLLAEWLRLDGYEVLEARDGRELRAYVDDCIFLDRPGPRVGAVVSDIWMPGMDGLHLLSYLQELPCDLPTILVSAFADDQVRRAARDLGAHTVLGKPVSFDTLKHSVRSALSFTDATPGAR